MKKTLMTLNDRTELTDAYHCIMNAVEQFSVFASNVPKTLMEVTQGIYGDLNSAARDVYRAANTYDVEEKIKCLDEAEQLVFFTYSSVEFLVKAHGITIGQANNYMTGAREAYTSIRKWSGSLPRD